MPRRELQGVVVSDRSDRTIVVRVERRLVHPLYGKFIRRSKKYHVHDDGNSCRCGDVVRIVESRPISRLKRWRLLEKVRQQGKAEGSHDPAGEGA